MSTDPLAGKPAPHQLLVDVPRLVSDYYSEVPDRNEVAERVAFGTSGHRGTSGARTFNDAHVAAVSQAVADHRRARGVTGPLYLGADTHALSTPATITALEVLTANGVDVIVAEGHGAVPTPVISRAILTHPRSQGVADGVVITPSHNPPEDGGFKYNPPHGGPAGSDETSVIEKLANDYLPGGPGTVKRQSIASARASGRIHERDMIGPYVDDLGAVLDLPRVAAAGVRIGVDPLGGSSLNYWGRIAERWGLDLTVVNDLVDPTFGFMTVDHDGKIRMDCSSPYAMAKLIDLRGSYDVAFGNDPDADRHGVVTPAGGLLNPNHYLAVAVEYLFGSRERWSASAKVGKTAVSSSMIDKVAGAIGREVAEVPVGFKWFVGGLLSGGYGFGGEESAGASFLRRDGSVWTTDKDGLIMGLLAAEMTAATGQDVAERYVALTKRFGAPAYKRVDVPATRAQKDALKDLSAGDVEGESLAGEAITAVLTRAPGNDEPIGGLKVVTESGWFAARPSGTEEIYKIYAESFRGEEHLEGLLEGARDLVAAAFVRAGAAEG